MKNAAETAYQPTEDEEGVADGAASLGADGGPVANATAADDDATAEEDFSDAFGDDAAWLNEELSDEELAALGEEDFGDDAFGDEAFEEELNAAFEDDELGSAPGIEEIEDVAEEVVVEPQAEA